MAYNSKYMITVVDKECYFPFEENSPIPALRQSNAEIHFAVTDDGKTNNKCKWYDWKSEMRFASKALPDYTFLVERHGEDSGDIERGYFCNGKYKILKPELVFPNFNGFD